VARRLLIAAGLVAAVVGALVLFLGDDTSERRDGIVVPSTDEEGPTSMESAPSPEELDEQVAAALAEGLSAESSAMERPTPMRRDGGLMGAMTGGMGGDLADPFLYQTPRERERRAEAARNRNWRNLDLVNSLIIGITEGIEKARAEGDTERVESLEATKGRLEARRDALQEALGDSPRPGEPRP
jgi:hypothetical protein